MIRFACAAVVAAIVIAPSVPQAQPVPPVRLSVATDGTQANGSSSLVEVSSQRPARPVLLGRRRTWSRATPTAIHDLFVRDRDTDADGVFDESGAVRTLRVSVGPIGEQLPDAFSDAQPVARWTLRPVLHRVSAGRERHERQRGRLPLRQGLRRGRRLRRTRRRTLSLVTTGTGDALAIGGGSTALQITPDGRYVLFSSRANNLQPRATPVTQIYRKDRVTGVTTLVSSTPDGTPADIGSAGHRRGDAGRRSHRRARRWLPGALAADLGRGHASLGPARSREQHLHAGSGAAAACRYRRTSIRPPKSPASRPTASVSISAT